MPISTDYAPGNGGRRGLDEGRLNLMYPVQNYSDLVLRELELWRSMPILIERAQETDQWEAKPPPGATYQFAC